MHSHRPELPYIALHWLSLAKSAYTCTLQTIADISRLSKQRKLERKEEEDRLQVRVYV